jgi:hypothetical protein
VKYCKAGPLQTGPGSDRRLGRTRHDDLGRFWHLDQRAHQRAGVLRRRQDVDVADGLCRPAQRACGVDAQAAGCRSDGRDDLVRGLGGHVQQHALPGCFQQLDAAQELFRALAAEAPEIVKLAVVDGLAQLLGGADRELAIELERPARAERGNPGELADAIGDVAAQVLQFGEGAGGRDLGQLGCD